MNDQIEAEVVTEEREEVATTTGTVPIHHSRVPLAHQQQLMCSNVLTISLHADATPTIDDHLLEAARVTIEDHLHGRPTLTSLVVAVKTDEGPLHLIEPAVLDPGHHHRVRASGTLLPDPLHLPRVLHEHQLIAAAHVSQSREAQDATEMIAVMKEPHVLQKDPHAHDHPEIAASEALLQTERDLNAIAMADFGRQKTHGHVLLHQEGIVVVHHAIQDHLPTLMMSAIG